MAAPALPVETKMAEVTHFNYTDSSWLEAKQPSVELIQLDPLVELEAQIARRADEIAATVSSRTPLNMGCWLQAEQEVLTRMELLGR
jgi:hypothetical protein